MKFLVCVLFFSLFASVIKGQVVNGNCGEGGGDNVVYEYNNETFIMIIRGSGNMGSYDLVPGKELPQPPWYEYMPYIGTVVIEEGVTSVGSDAFSQAWSVKTVTIASSVTTIEYRAFANTAITSLVIPASVKTIGGMAFVWNLKLKTVTIMSELTSIGASGFKHCPLLESVTYLGSSTPSCDYEKEEDEVFFESPLVDFVAVPGSYGASSFCKKSVSKDGVIVTSSSSKKEVMMIFTVMLTIATFLVYL